MKPTSVKQMLKEINCAIDQRKREDELRHDKRTVEKIRERFYYGMSIEDLAKIFDLKKSVIRDLVRGVSQNNPDDDEDLRLSKEPKSTVHSSAQGAVTKSTVHSSAQGAVTKSTVHSSAQSLPYKEPKYRKHKPYNQGTENGRSKINQAKADQIRVLYAGGKYSIRRLAKMFSISPSQVVNILKEKHWK